jgi:hypothetical protein
LLVDGFGAFFALFSRPTIGGGGQEFGEGAQAQVFAGFANDDRPRFLACEVALG